VSEFYAQGDAERDAALEVRFSKVLLVKFQRIPQVSPIMDRRKPIPVERLQGNAAIALFPEVLALKNYVQLASSTPSSVLCSILYRRSQA
jgi:hypothetical protein